MNLSCLYEYTRSLNTWQNEIMLFDDATAKSLPNNTSTTNKRWPSDLMCQVIHNFCKSSSTNLTGYLDHNPSSRGVCWADVYGPYAVLVAKVWSAWESLYSFTFCLLLWCLRSKPGGRWGNVTWESLLRKKNISRLNWAERNLIMAEVSLLT